MGWPGPDCGQDMNPRLLSGMRRPQSYARRAQSAQAMVKLEDMQPV